MSSVYLSPDPQCIRWNISCMNRGWIPSNCLEKEELQSFQQKSSPRSCYVMYTFFCYSLMLYGLISKYMSDVLLDGFLLSAMHYGLNGFVLVAGWGGERQDRACGTCRYMFRTHGREIVGVSITHTHALTDRTVMLSLILCESLLHAVSLICR